MQNRYEAPDISTEMALRQAAATQESFVAFQSTRAVSGSADSTFSFGARAIRPATGLQGDRYFATDRQTLYCYSGTAWIVVVGFDSGTDATRAAITPDVTDNGAFFFTTDTCKLWEVSGGAWVDRFVSLDATTSYEVAGTKVVGARETGWTAGTGTANKGAFTTYAGQDCSAAYVEAEAQATDDATKANAQRIKAIEDMLRTHGLMN